MIVFGVVCLRKRQKKTRHPPFTSDVTFSQLSEENGDPYLRPRDNTYVEIPFLSQDLPVVLNRVSETPPLPERHASAASLDSIAEAKLKAALDDKANQSG
uniref:Uncharacterized protein n=1 Tax=Ciona savignyi TaxID=51511 RepID=H2ZEM8_CIOSA